MAEKDHFDDEEGLDLKHARERLLHALLLHQIEQESDVDNLVEKCLSHIRHDSLNSTSVPLKHRFDRVNMSWLGAAASVLIVCVLIFLTPSKNVAVAAIDKILITLEQASDRTFDLTVESVATERNSNQLNVLTGKLFLRDHNQFVLLAARDDGTRLIKGSNHHESWQISSNGKKLRVAEPGEIKLPIFGRARNFISLDLNTALHELKEGYTLTLTDSVVLDDFEGEQIKIVGSKNDRRMKGFNHIEIYADSESYEIRRLVFDRIPLRGAHSRHSGKDFDFQKSQFGENTSKVKVTLNLISTRNLHDDFFDARYHSIPTE